MWTEARNDLYRIGLNGSRSLGTVPDRTSRALPFRRWFKVGVGSSLPLNESGYRSDSVKCLPLFSFMLGRGMWPTRASSVRRRPEIGPCSARPKNFAMADKLMTRFRSVIADGNG